MRRDPAAFSFSGDFPFEVNSLSACISIRNRSYYQHSKLGAMKLNKSKIFEEGYISERLPFQQEFEFHNKLHTELPVPKQIPNYETPEQKRYTYRIQGISDKVNTQEKAYLLYNR